MQSKLFTGLLAAALFSSGCIVVSGGGDGTRTGDLQIFYTFGGQECGPAGVSDISIRVTGIDTSDGYSDTVDCATFRQGIRIDDLAVGEYNVDIDGLDSAGYLLYETPTPVRAEVFGGTLTEYDVNAVSALPAVGTVEVYWRGFDGQGCGQSGVTQVRAILYDDAERVLDDQTFSCSDAGVIWDDVAVGTYSIWLEGASPTMLYESYETIQVREGSNQFDFDLVGVTGDLTVYYTFDGTGSCDAAGVAQVRAIVETYYGETWDQTYTCENQGGIAYDMIYEGAYTVDLLGIAYDGAVLYESDPVAVDVVAGADNTYNIDLY